MKKIVAIPIAGVAIFSVFTGCFGRDAEPDVEPVVDEPTPKPVEVVLTLEEQRTEDYLNAIATLRDQTEAAKNTYFECLETTIFQGSWDESSEQNEPLRDVLLGKAKILLESQ